MNAPIWRSTIKIILVKWGIFLKVCVWHVRYSLDKKSEIQIQCLREQTATGPSLVQTWLFLNLFLFHCLYILYIFCHWSLNWILHYYGVIMGFTFLVLTEMPQKWNLGQIFIHRGWIQMNLAVIHSYANLITLLLKCKTKMMNMVNIIYLLKMLPL